MAETPTLSFAVLHPENLKRTNGFLKDSGYMLQPLPIKEPPFFAGAHLQRLDGEPTGISITDGGIGKRNPTYINNRINTWVDERINPSKEQVDGLLTLVATAEEAAHKSMGNRTKPDFKSTCHQLDPLNSMLKGRIEASGWHQPVFPGKTPEPEIYKCIMMQHYPADFMYPDGTLLRVKAEGVLAKGPDGKFTSFDPEVDLVGMGKDRTTSPQEAYVEAERYCNAYKTIEDRNRLRLKDAPDIAVFEESSGRGSLISKLSNNRIETWKTYGWKDAAVSALEREGVAIQQQHQRKNKSLDSVSQVAADFKAER